MLGKQLENVQKGIRTQSCHVLDSCSCKLSCMSSLYATVQTVAQKIKNLIPLQMSVRKGAGVLKLVRGWGLKGVRLMRALLRAKNTFLHFYSATSFVPGVHSSISLVGQTKSQPQNNTYTHTHKQTVVGPGVGPSPSSWNSSSSSGGCL